MVHNLWHHNDDQQTVFEQCLEYAERRDSGMIEVASLLEFNASAVPSSLPLSGCVVSVSDALDVVGFSTRYGVNAKTLHKVPDRSFPLVVWMQSQGARVVGKLHCGSPLAWNDAFRIKKIHNPHGAALREKCCHVALTSSFVGIAGANGSIMDDFTAFKPTTSVFPVEEMGFGGTTGSIAIVSKQLDDVNYLWKCYTGEIRAHSDNDIAPSSPNKNLLRSTAPRPLKVGYPSQWIDKYCGDRYLAVDFEVKLKSLCETFLRADPMRRKKVNHITFVPVDVSLDISNLVPLVDTISTYELAQIMHKDRSKSAITGLMEELPTQIVSRIFDGRKVSEPQYLSARTVVEDGIHSAVEEMFTDVDLLCVPLLCEPFQDGNMRSFTTSIPFFMTGNPVVSLHLDKELSVLLVGEVGRDSGLLEDATSFVDQVKGTSPTWWKRKWFGE